MFQKLRYALFSAQKILWVVDTHLDILDRSEGSKELPEDVLLSLGRQVVDEDAPARAVGGHARQQGVTRQQVPSQWWESAKTTIPSLCESLVTYGDINPVNCMLFKVGSHYVILSRERIKEPIQFIFYVHVISKFN